MAQADDVTRVAELILASKKPGLGSQAPNPETFQSPPPVDIPLSPSMAMGNSHSMGTGLGARAADATHDQDIAMGAIIRRLEAMSPEEKDAFSRYLQGPSQF